MGVTLGVVAISLRFVTTCVTSDSHHIRKDSHTLQKSERALLSNSSQVIQAMPEKIHFFSGNRPLALVLEKRNTPNEFVIIHNFDTDLIMIPHENFRGKEGNI